MNNEQAIAIIGNLECDTYSICESQEAKFIAIYAISLLIAEKPTGIKKCLGDTKIGDCPNCGIGTNSEYSRCHICGQKIDWD